MADVKVVVTLPVQGGGIDVRTCFQESTMMALQYVVVGMIAYQILKMIGLAINQAVIEHRQKRFLTLIQVTFPENEKITFISTTAPNRKAMRDMERHIRAHYKVEEGKTITLL